MGLFSKDIKNMDDLLLHGLHDIYYAEQEITKALPKMIEQATNRDLAQGLKNHLEDSLPLKGTIERPNPGCNSESVASDTPATRTHT